MKIYFFDFDETITTKDTFIEFLKFSKGDRYFYLTSIVIVFYFFLFKLNVISAENSKRYILKFYFKGYNKEKLDQLGSDFIKYISSNGIIKNDFLTIINLAKSNNHTVVVVSASFDIWVEKFCFIHSLTCICTNLSYDRNNIFNGLFSTPNCNGEEKAKRINDSFTLSDFSEIIVYGDSKGDIEMMNLATSKNWVKG